jgi:hypothetical protein
MNHVWFEHCRYSVVPKTKKCLEDIDKFIRENHLDECGIIYCLSWHEWTVKRSLKSYRLVFSCDELCDFFLFKLFFLYLPLFIILCVSLSLSDMRFDKPWLHSCDLLHLCKCEGGIELCGLWIHCLGMWANMYI